MEKMEEKKKNKEKEMLYRMKGKVIIVSPLMECATYSTVKAVSVSVLHMFFPAKSVPTQRGMKVYLTWAGLHAGSILVHSVTSASSHCVSSAYSDREGTNEKYDAHKTGRHPKWGGGTL